MALSTFPVIDPKTRQDAYPAYPQSEIEKVVTHLVEEDYTIETEQVELIAENLSRRQNHSGTCPFKYVWNWTLLSTPEFHCLVAELNELKLGAGSQRTAYAAEMIGSHKKVACLITDLQPLSSRERTCISREIDCLKTLSELQIPSVLKVLGVISNCQTYFLVTELCPNGDLENRIKSEPIAPSQARQWIKQLFQGVAGAHAAGITHRDIKPSNCLIDAENQLKITDWGYAIKMDEIDEKTPGTSKFFPPERYAVNLGKPESADLRVSRDVWSAAVVAYLVCGFPHFLPNEALPPKTTGAEAKELRREKDKLNLRHIYESGLPFSGMTEEGERWFALVLAPRPENRASAQVALDAFPEKDLL